MSQKTARRTRQSNGNAVEKPPDLLEHLGLDDFASIEADRIRGMAVRLHMLNRDQEDEELKDTDAIPGVPSEPDGAAEVNGRTFRTFGQQRTRIKKAYNIAWKKVEADGYRALVEQKLNEAKSR